MPNNWKTYKLGEFLEIKNGKTKPKEIGDIPIYGGNGILGFTNKSNVNKDVLIIGRVGAYCGSVYFEVNPVWISDNALYTFPKKDDNLKFIYYLLKQLDLNQFAGGSSQPLLTQDTLNRIEVTLPPLQEQKAIAAILSAIDDKIENNLAINKTLEEMAMALYKHWFVDSAIDDWEKCILKDLIEIKGGFSYKGEFIGKGDSLLLGMGCVSFKERFVSSGARLYSGECTANHYVQPGEIVLATRQQSDNYPILGQPAIIPKYLSGNKIIVGTNLYRVKNNSELSNSLLFQLLKSKEYMEHVLANASGTTVKMITKDVIELYKLALPPRHLILNYNEKISAISDKIEQNTIENQTLTQLRDTLLPKLISGEVRLKEFQES